MYSFQRYLSAKKTVDDRALNQHVWQALVKELPQPARVLEIGAGIGTMFERMLDWGLLKEGDYTGIDAQPENIASALERFPSWTRQHGFNCQPAGPGGFTVEKEDQHLAARFETADVFDLINKQHPLAGKWDLLVAHAFLDLLDIPIALPKLFTLLEPGGLFYFTINFDGQTLLEPTIDLELDEKIQALYHATMDERLTDGLPSGDSRVGRHLFSNLRAAGGRVIQAGASDWVVWSTGTPPVYPADEAYFLHFIVDTIHSALQGHPKLNRETFEDWTAERHAQIERGELVYIAHQLDFCGTIVPRN